MGSGTLANQALCSHHSGLFAHVRTDTESTTSSSSRKVLHKRTAFFGLLNQKRVKGRYHGPRQPDHPHAGVSCNAMLETSAGIKMDGLVAEVPFLLALSSDFNWDSAVTDLRKEALCSLSAHSQIDTDLERLEALMHGWLHDGMLETLLQPALMAGVQSPEEELGLRIRGEELRSQAALQAIEELARGVDSSFDWETEVAELYKTLRNQQHLRFEQQLWQSWESAHEGMGEEANHLHEEALDVQHLQNEVSQNLAFLSESKQEQTEFKTSLDKAFEKSGTWWTLGAGMMGLFGLHTTDAIAVDETVSSAIAQAATKAAPGWVAPSVLAFPVVSYFLFNVYREKVNPYAKLTDWMFGLLAMAIVGNIVLISTVGVRLY